jgi:hypothetical protein
MKKKELKKLNMKMKMVDNDDENQGRTFVIIIMVILAALMLVYGGTELLGKKKTEEKTETTENESINYDRVSIGTILNRPYDDYYVMLYDSKGEDATTYSSILSNYMAKKDEENYIKIYYCDLNNSINSEYYNVNNDNKSNPKAKTIEELDLGDLTLIRVKNGKISKYVENVNEIKDLLK